MSIEELIKHKTIESAFSNGEVFTILFTDKTSIKIIGGSSSGWGMVNIEYYNENNDLIYKE